MQENYTEIKLNDKTIYLIGTAHVSKISAEEVKKNLEDLNPDSICIELDQKRYDTLKNPGKWKETNIIDVIKNKETGLLLVNIILSNFQKRVAKQLDSNSGQEMVEGIKYSTENHTELVLADRSVQTTFMRVWRKHNFINKIKLLVSVIMSMFEDEDITEEDLMNLRKSDMLDAAINDVAKQFPMIKQVMLDERDQYLAEKIKTAKGPTVVAILGAAHVKGVSKELYNNHNLEELDSIPPKTLMSKISGWIIPVLLICLVAYTLLTNLNQGYSQITSWILWNSILSAIGVLICKGHFLSIVVAFFLAPITSLNPLLAVGWFAGLTEAFVKKPTVNDFQNLSFEHLTYKSLTNNAVTRILLIVLSANLFSTLGTFISGLDIVKKFLEIF